MDQTSRILSLRDVASQINSGGDLATVLQHLIAAACRHANWALGSIMSIDAAHGFAHVIVRHDPTLIHRDLPDRWELATSPSLIEPTEKLRTCRASTRPAPLSNSSHCCTWPLSELTNA